MCESEEKLNSELGSHLANWPLKLFVNSRAGTLLSKIKIYHDFEPLKLHLPTMKCPGGKDFTADVRRQAGSRRACILLTIREDLDKWQFVSDEEHVQVVKATDLRNLRQGTSVTSYLASATNLTSEKIGALSQLDQNAIAALMSEDFPVKDVAKALESNEVACGNLLSLILELGGTEQNPSESAQREVVKAIEAASPDNLKAFFASMARLDKEQRNLLFSKLTESAERISDAELVLVQKIETKIAQVRRDIEVFRALIANPAAGETACQEFLEDHPWMFGFGYVAVRPTPHSGRGKCDFLLERSDGFHDMLELKSPGDKVIDIKATKSELSSPPSQFHLTPELANALAQAHQYRYLLTSREQTITQDSPEGSKIFNTRHPKIFIILGTRSATSEGAQRVVEEINRTMHRVEIMFYDDVARRAEVIIENAVKYLANREEGSEASGEEQPVEDNDKIQSGDVV